MKKVVHNNIVVMYMAAIAGAFVVCCCCSSSSSVLAYINGMIPGTPLYAVKKLKGMVKSYMSTGDRHFCPSIYNALKTNKEKYANTNYPSLVNSNLSEAERGVLEKIYRVRGECVDTNKVDDYLNAMVETEKKPLHVDISGDCNEIKKTGKSLRRSYFAGKEKVYIWDRSKNTFVEGEEYIYGKISKTKLDQLGKRCIKAGVAIR